MADAHDAMLIGLQRLGLVGPADDVELVPLTGGVASDIWLVRGSPHRFVVKRALERLRVAADWQVPVTRNAAEVAWLRHAGNAVPEAVPKVLAHCPELGFFVMEFLEPKTHPVWKMELKEGRADPVFARKVGEALVQIHAKTAGRQSLVTEVNDDALFNAIRIEPYLQFTAARHPEIASHLEQLGRRTLTTHIALVHGDISPKNILAGPRGPVFLDAECAWYGDPAFDLAFCLNHLLLKCLWNRDARPRLLASFDALSSAYLAGVRWEDPAELEARAASLLPALLLARIDGKSPVEYITEEDAKAFVRRLAIPLVKAPPRRLSTVRGAWDDSLAGNGAL